MYPINEEIWGHVKSLGSEALETAEKVRKFAGLKPRIIRVDRKELTQILKS